MALCISQTPHKVTIMQATENGLLLIKGLLDTFQALLESVVRVAFMHFFVHRAH